MRPAPALCAYLRRPAGLCTPGLSAVTQEHRDHRDLQAKENRSGRAGFRPRAHFGPALFQRLGPARFRSARQGFARAHQRATDSSLRESECVTEIASPQTIVAFWHEAGPDKWYEKVDAFDREIRERFL